MNRDALVIGIDQYPFLKDSPTSKAKHLKTPANDAEAIALRLEEYGGFRVRRLPESIQEEQRQVDPKKLVQGDALHEAIIQLMNYSDLLTLRSEFLTPSPTRADFRF